ncbi:MAG: hypothetical protein NUV61_01865 [Candidatus Azambacteria bacterium]|nr:hypothetical protein [Candidatus Azambacteria bacterium]
MDQNNKTGQEVSSTGGAPGELPVVGEKKFFTHTMQEDVARAKMDPASFAKEVASKKPFSEYIPPVSSPREPEIADKFREPVEDLMGRDQPFPLPDIKSEGEGSQPFQIRIPQKRRAANITTVILIAVLLILVAGGGAAYWWFFMRAPAPEVVVKIPEPQVVPQQQPTPVIPVQLEPAPEPEPPIIQELEPEPIATTTEPVVIPEPVATTTQPELTPPPPLEVSEPATPEAVIALEHTALIEITRLDKALLFEKIQAENTKIVSENATIRYAVKLSTESEKRFLTGEEVVTLLGVLVPADFWKLTSNAELIGYKQGASLRYGFAATIQNKTSVKNAALSWEGTMLNDLTALYIEKAYQKPEVVVFSTNTYFDFYKRFINMPEPDTSLDWAVSSRYFVTATSKEMIYAVLDKARQPVK